MRGALIVAATIALLACFPTQMRALAADATSVMLEAAPWIAASRLLSHAPLGRLIPYLGCGCTPRGARSLPAALLAALLFGPIVAIARVAAAVALERFDPSPHAHDDGTLLDDLLTLVPSALIVGCAAVFAPELDLAHRPPLVALAIGVILGVRAPCVVGAMALAAALRTQAPLASIALLCTSGIVVPARVRHRSANDDRAAYAAFALLGTLAFVTHGATLINPRLAWTQALLVIACIVAMRRPHRLAPHARWVAIALLVACVLGAPAPAIDVGDATLRAVYPGERVHFEGRYERGALVRYSILCCRADAIPIVARLLHPLPGTHDWVETDATVVSTASSFALAPQRWRDVAPPDDPFVYE